MHAHPNLDWTICYLTYDSDDYRGSELKKFWDKRKIKTKFLGYVDDWHDIENKRISFNEARAWIDIQEAINFANRCSSQVVQKKGTAKVNINEL